MNEAIILEIGRDAIWVVLQLSGPIMIAGLGIGLIIALFQALTTIQEMTLTFVPKILVIFLSLILFLPFMMTTLIEFSQRLFGMIVVIG
ncbi:MAG: flagellar biosynthesis protein FliQ [Proteobacteria bacterium]|nr:flagellar biosynthesis protein FliQ [Pseudomonadota bacterium]